MASHMKSNKSVKEKVHISLISMAMDMTCSPKGCSYLYQIQNSDSVKFEQECSVWKLQHKKHMKWLYLQWSSNVCLSPIDVYYNVFTKKLSKMNFIAWYTTICFRCPLK